jgi:hypothetical protein
MKFEVSIVVKTWIVVLWVMKLCGGEHGVITQTTTIHFSGVLHVLA